jgi:hypothetical protein
MNLISISCSTRQSIYECSLFEVRTNTDKQRSICVHRLTLTNMCSIMMCHSSIGFVHDERIDGLTLISIDVSSH